ncbi:hypothetical protein FCV25MIE_15828, partial [Fagus crenata]
ELAIGSGQLISDPSPSDDLLVPSSSCPVDSSFGKETDSSSEETDSSSEEFNEDIEVNEMAVVCSQEIPSPAVWVDLAPPERDSPIGSDLEAPMFPLLSDTIYEVRESSHFVGSSSEGVDGELMLTSIEEPLADTAPPL